MPSRYSVRLLSALALAWLCTVPAAAQMTPAPQPGLAPLQRAAQPANVVQTDNVRAELVAEVTSIRPGEPFWVGLKQTIRPKWHTYWRNPGDSGMPTELKWQLPAG